MYFLTLIFMATIYLYNSQFSKLFPHRNIIGRDIKGCLWATFSLQNFLENHKGPAAAQLAPCALLHKYVYTR